jgi:hypothetical protein
VSINVYKYGLIVELIHPLQGTAVGIWLKATAPKIVLFHAREILNTKINKIKYLTNTEIILP